MHKAIFILLSLSIGIILIECRDTNHNLIHNRIQKRQTLTLCNATSCLNGGTCLAVGYNLAMCVCTTGYTGWNCGFVVASNSSVTTTVAGATTTTTTASSASTSTTASVPTTTLTLAVCQPGICQNGKKINF